MYPHHISCVKLIDQIGNGGGKCGRCRLKRRALARQMSTVRNQVRTIQSISPQPQANMKPFSPKITPKSFLCAYCKPSILHTTMGICRHQAVEETDWKICLLRGLWGFLVVLQSWVPCSKALIFFFSPDWGRLDPRPFGAPRASRFTSCLAFQAQFCSEVSEHLGCFYSTL